MRLRVIPIPSSTVPVTGMVSSWIKPFSRTTQTLTSPDFFPQVNTPKQKSPHIPIRVDEQNKHKFDVLHEYWHFDPWGWKEGHTEDEYLCDIIEDNVLRTVIDKNLSEEAEMKSGVSYLFGVRRGSDILHGDIV